MDQNIALKESLEPLMDLPATVSFEQMREKLIQKINGLIQTDFQQLVGLLYRVDVHEGKLKFLLRENVGEDAAVIIADLIIQRQLEKIKSRAQYRAKDNPAGDAERW